jgi:hypothetical protein
VPGQVFEVGDYKGIDSLFQLALTPVEDDEDLMFAILQVAKEQLGNIREFQYSFDMSQRLWIEVSVTWQQVTLTIIDTGKCWRDDGYYHCPDAEEQMQKLLEELATRGRGHLIMAMLTHLSGRGSLEYQCGGRIRIGRWLRKPRA